MVKASPEAGPGVHLRPRDEPHERTFTLPSPLEVSFSKAAWAAPVSNDPVTIAFRQHVGAADALRTGAYSKTLTFTLSTAA
jgi:hypothetical protein